MNKLYVLLVGIIVVILLFAGFTGLLSIDGTKVIVEQTEHPVKVARIYDPGKYAQSFKIPVSMDSVELTKIGLYFSNTMRYLKVGISDHLLEGIELRYRGGCLAIADIPQNVNPGWGESSLSDTIKVTSGVTYYITIFAFDDRVDVFGCEGGNVYLGGSAYYYDISIDRWLEHSAVTDIAFKIYGYSEEADGGDNGVTPTPPVNHIPTATRPSGPSIGEVYTTYTFSTNTYDQDGDAVDCKWSFGDGTITSWVSDSNQHFWNIVGTYYIKVKPRDANGLEGSWSSTHAITINDPTEPLLPDTYTVNIYVKTADTEEPIDAVTVTMDDTTKTTDLDGYTNFVGVTKGSHDFTFEKEGFTSFADTYTITANSNINIKLTPRGIPGFELFSLVVAIGVAFCILRRKR